MTENNINGTRLAKVVRMANISDSFQKVFKAQGDIFNENFFGKFTDRLYEENSFVDFCESQLIRELFKYKFKKFFFYI